MKRLLALVLLAAGCSSPTTQLPADLASPQALAVSGNELFVASTNTDELRVLELQTDPTLRRFASAPNPIYVLSVPVVRRPIALAADTRDGATGPYVFVLSAVEQQLGIVDARNKKQVAAVALPGVPLSLAALTVDANVGAAKVYVGVSLGNQRGAIAEVDVTSLADLRANGARTPPPARVAYLLGRAAPEGLALSPDTKTLAVGDRLADEATLDLAARRGGVIFVDLASGNLTRIPVGGPAGKVIFSPAASSSVGCDAGLCPDVRAAGDFLYAVVESTGCPSGQRCGGIQTLLPAGDGGYVRQQLDGGEPLAPVRIPGVATDLAVGAALPDAGLLYLSGNRATATTLMLAAPSTDGFVYFLDGRTGTAYDVGTADAGETSPVTHFDPDGGVVVDAAPLGPQLDDGGVAAVPKGGLENQTVGVAYQGALPVLEGRAAGVVGGALVDGAVDFAQLGVQQGDEVDFDGGAAGCPLLATVTAIPDAGILGLSPTIADGCFPPSGGAVYTVRVGTPAQPYLVAGTVAGYLGRVAPNQSFQSTVQYFARVPGVFDPTVPALAFRMGSGDPRRGASFAFNVSGHFEPLSAGGGARTIEPGPAVWAPNLGKFYVGFPGSEGGSVLSEIDPIAVVPGSGGGSVQFQ